MDMRKVSVLLTLAGVILLSGCQLFGVILGIGVPELKIDKVLVGCGNVGVPYQGLVEIDFDDHGTPPYFWSVKTGDWMGLPGITPGVPPGLSLSPIANTAERKLTISGTPTQVGHFAFTLQVEDSKFGQPKRDETPIIIRVGPTVTSLVPAEADRGGLDFQITVNGEGFASGQSQIRWGSAPRQTTFVNGQQLQAVVPSTQIANQGQFDIGVQDARVIAGSPPMPVCVSSLPFTVRPPGSILMIQTISLPMGNVGQPYPATQLQATGGPFGGVGVSWTWSPKAGSVFPPGLVLTIDGDLLGTPTASGTFEVTIGALDNSTPTLTDFKDFTITILSGFTISTSALAGVVEGFPYPTTTLQATGGTGALTWSLAAGSNPLPPGLNLAPNGDITGTATASGTFGFTVQVQDSSMPTPQTATKMLSITVQPALAVTTAMLPVGTVGRAYTPTALQAANSNGTLTWSLTAASGTLPPGLNLAANGDLTGTPTASGTFNITVEATDSGPPQQTATRDLSIQVNNPTPSITTLTPNNAVAGGSGFTLTIDGMDFVPGAQVLWQGSPRTPATLVNLNPALGTATQLTVMIPAGDITVGRTVDVQVENPAPVGGVSNMLTFTVNNPAPALTSLQPASATEGGPQFTLTVNGTGFVFGTAVNWDGAFRLTTFVSGTQLTATIPDTDIAAAGSAQVTVMNPAPGGGISNALTFNINAPTGPGVVELIGLAGQQPSFSANGRHVAFQSMNATLVLNDMNGATDIFVREDTDGDGTFDKTVRVSVDSSGTEADADSTNASITPDGRFVAFQSQATNLVAGDTNNVADIFVHDRDADENGIFDEPGGIATVRVSIDAGGTQGDGDSGSPAISATGRFVIFTSLAENLIAVDGNFSPDLFVHDRDVSNDGIYDQPGDISTTRLAEQSASFSPGSAAITPDGRFVAFESFNSSLVASDMNMASDVFVLDRDVSQDGSFDDPADIKMVRVSVSSVGAEASLFGNSSRPSISADGRHVAFVSLAANLDSVTADTNSARDVFVHDRDPNGDGFDGADQSTIRVSVSASGVQTDAGNADEPSISSDGRFVAFSAEATNLGITNPSFHKHAYVHDRDADEDQLFDEAGATDLVGVSVRVVDGVEGDLGGFMPSLAGDGRFAAIFSNSSNFLMADPTPSVGDVYLARSNFDPSQPVPNITALSPASSMAGGDTFVLEVTGTGFTPRSVVQWGPGNDRATFYVSNARLLVRIWAGDIVSAGNVDVTVVNPAPGGGTSNVFPFTVN